MLFSIGCSESLPGSLGEDVLPPGDTLGVVNTDTFTVILDSKLKNEVQTGDAPLSLIGNYVDPELGRISATTYHRLRLPGVEVEFGEQLQFESIELHLRAVSFYGNLVTPQSMEVYSLTEGFADSTDDLTSLSTPPARAPLNLAGDYIIDFSESNNVGDIVLDLDASLGEFLLFATSDDLLNDEAFQEYMDGLAITTSPVGFRTTREPGAVFYLDMASQETYLELGYSRFDPTTNERVSEVFNFRFDGASDGFHTIERTETGDRLLGLPGVEEDDMYEFIQAGALITTFFDIPAIGDLPQVAINRAQITLSVESEFFGGGGRFVPPGNILAYRADENGSELRDDEGRPTLFGIFAYNTAEGGYVMDLAGHVQQVVSNRRENFGFILVPEDSAFTLNRAILAGTAHPTLAPKLNLTYTRLP